MKLIHSTYLGKGLAGDDSNISWVLNANNDTSSQEKLLPSVLQVDDVGAYHLT